MCSHKYTGTCTMQDTHIHVHTYTHVDASAHTHTYAHTHTHTNIHTRTQTHLFYEKLYTLFMILIYGGQQWSDTMLVW